MPTVSEWLEGHADRVAANQRAQAETVKLLATFSAVFAATIVATGLQVGPPTRLDLVAAILLLISVAATVAVVLLDRITDVNPGSVLQEATVAGWDDTELVRELRLWRLAAVENNAQVITLLRRALAIQILLSVASATVAAVSLLIVD